MMAALTPAGWIYPSQEMAFAAVEPGRAPGTAEWYRVGDLAQDPVMDPKAIARVGTLRRSHMRPPPGYDRAGCVAAICLGGCHCRYVGQDGIDPRSRYDVPVGACQAMRAAVEGMGLEPLP